MVKWVKNGHRRRMFGQININTGNIIIINYIIRLEWSIHHSYVSRYVYWWTGGLISVPVGDGKGRRNGPGKIY